ncbi:DUF2513 domain-containing protein, partial [Gluconacetobacter aggeris]
MRRDMELVRSLLLRLEEVNIPPGANITFYGYEDEIAVDGYEPDVIALHLFMLLDGGLLKGKNMGRGVMITDLSWAGHEFLDSVRDGEVWKRTKDGATRAGGFTIGLLGDLAKAILKGEIVKHTGLP